jgi:hypothetical protein
VTINEDGVKQTCVVRGCTDGPWMIDTLIIEKLMSDILPFARLMIARLV